MLDPAALRDAVDVTALACEERAELAAFLESLSPWQWELPTLCAKWRVRDVVAHMVSYEELTKRGLIARFAKGWFRPAQVNALGVAEYNKRSPVQLVALLRDHIEPRGLTAAFGGRIALLDALIHHQDIRRPLGVARSIPADRLRCALDFAMIAPPIRAFLRARGLRLIATDLHWSSGSGPEVRGPGEAILMAAAGRRGVVGELTGPGQATLAERVER